MRHSPMTQLLPTNRLASLQDARKVLEKVADFLDAQEAEIEKMNDEMKEQADLIARLEDELWEMRNGRYQ